MPRTNTDLPIVCKSHLRARTSLPPLPPFLLLSSSSFSSFNHSRGLWRIDEKEREREREGTKPDTKHRVARRRRGGGGGGRRKEGGTRGWREVSEQGGVGAPFVIYICVFYTLFTASIILHFICSRVGRSEGRTHGKERNKGRRKSFLVY